DRAAIRTGHALTALDQRVGSAAVGAAARPGRAIPPPRRQMPLESRSSGAVARRLTPHVAAEHVRRPRQELEREAPRPRLRVGDALAIPAVVLVHEARDGAQDRAPPCDGAAGAILDSTPGAPRLRPPLD